MKIYLADSLTHIPIAYASITDSDNNAVSYSNNRGFFVISDWKRITVSSVGYISRRIAIDRQTDTVYLSPKTYELPEIAVSPGRKAKNIIIGYADGKSALNISNSSGEELAVLIKNKEGSYHTIKSVILKAGRNEHMLKYLGVNFVSVFKINFYAVAKDGMPGELLNSKDLIYTSEILKEKTILDVSQLNLVMPVEGVFVSVEWVGKEDKGNKDLYIISKASLEPWIKTTFDVSDSVVYIKDASNEYKWRVVDRNHLMSLALKKENGFTPLISLLL